MILLCWNNNYFSGHTFVFELCEVYNYFLVFKSQQNLTSWTIL